MMLDVYLSMLDLGYFELSEAFKGLKDEHVWQRPAEGLLSIGELAGHISYWEANKFTGEGKANLRPDLDTCKVKSLLIDERFSYYPGTLAASPTDEQRAMTAEQVHKEMVRIHEETFAYFKTQNPDLDTAPKGYNPHFTYRELLKYAIFHISYHTGQMYTVRHVLGEETPDN